jgi:hypothetical protein
MVCQADTVAAGAASAESNVMSIVVSISSKFPSVGGG